MKSMGVFGTSTLVVQACARRCAIPMAHVLEVMRPLPVDAVLGMPPYVLGLSVIRGRPTPVVELARLFPEGERAEPSRYVTLRVGDRRLALAVEAVLGVHDLAPGETEGFPPLLGSESAELIESLAVLDAKLLVALTTTRLIPEGAWAELAVGEGPA
jgi:purine-binding chemotaxis protein CheW